MLNNTEKYLFGASSALMGLGLQYFLPVQHQIPLNRIGNRCRLNLLDQKKLDELLVIVSLEKD